MNAEHVTLARSWYKEIWKSRRCELIDQLIAVDSFCLGKMTESFALSRM